MYGSFKCTYAPISFWLAIQIEINPVLRLQYDDEYILYIVCLYNMHRHDLFNFVNALLWQAKIKDYGKKTKYIEYIDSDRNFRYY